MMVPVRWSVLIECGITAGFRIAIVKISKIKAQGKPHSIG
jgi:hypothetical protein